MPPLVAAALIGVTVGLRTITAPAVLSWAASAGVLNLAGTWLAFMGASWTPYILTVLAIAELVNDKLPITPSRKAPGPFAGRVLAGALCGAMVGAPTGQMAIAGVAGALGAVAGQFGGYEFRIRLVSATGGRDLPIALLEDAIAVAAAITITLLTF